MTNINEKELDDYQEKLNVLFDLTLSKIGIRLASNRVEYDEILGRKTASWQIGNSMQKKNYNSVDKSILILDPQVWPQEAPEHKPDEFLSLAKHEITHLYTDELASGKELPVWLMEGLSGYLSGQYKRMGLGKKITKDFCHKFDTFPHWKENLNFGAYPISFNFVEFMVSKFGFAQIKKLILQAPKKYSYEEWDKLVKTIFNKNLSDLETEFLNTKNSIG